MRLSLKKKIILLFLLAMILTVAFFAFYFYYSTRDLLSESEHNLEVIVTNSIAQEIEDNLSTTKRCRNSLPNAIARDFTSICFRLMGV